MNYDVIIVGTGAGGATVAHELSTKNLNVLVLEKGLNIQKEQQPIISLKHQIIA